MITIREFKEFDFNSVKEIYQQGIDTGNATFQEKAKSWLEWDNSMLSACRIVAVENNNVVGWAALSPISSRNVYSGVAEVSVYVANESLGKGIGRKLLTQLIKESEANSIWMLQAGIFPENRASIALHEKCGFRILGVRDKLGKMKEVWRDVVLMERRSAIIGVN
tara:strand:+ start:90 stop:584 length:495 start_codon:yes stop_codon:yes gene_type:complete